ncbi:serine/threonine-protein kinase VRK1-like [Corticium candelabrum]|uniref:serine/threonine-protein kinase VRK1-like n=1 Tax=Corticium candelabrum TaxID=121492 RepID=UPI002E277247|nr:serine/threonine-protein kinase VRK1-like [Corticium candelabrum]
MKRSRMAGKRNKADSTETSPPKKAKPSKEASSVRRPKVAGTAKQAKRKLAAKRRVAAKSSYDFPEPMPVGEVLADMQKGNWKLGKSIGRGGFGELYLAQRTLKQMSEDEDKEANYVVKIEPEGNGPLFTEIHFYTRVGKAETIQTWCKSHRLSIGVPCYVAHGKHTKRGKSYRFLVLPRLGDDLEKLFVKCGRIFSAKTVCQLALTILNSLEYLHEHEYVHADIKGSNLLVESVKGACEQVYLVDYGLVSRYTIGGKHREYKEDPRKAHDGTVEFTSIDAHNGVAPSRRGDLEILGYVLLQWSCGQLPWEVNLSNKDYVKKEKQNLMENLDSRLSSCFSTGRCPGELLEYFKYVKGLLHADKPDYGVIRRIFRNALRRQGHHNDGVYDWNVSSPLVQKHGKKMKRVKAGDSDAKSKPKSKP